MAFYVFNAVEREFLADDQRNWTSDFFGAAEFTSRDIADDVVIRVLGEGHGAYVFDDGIEA